MVATVGSMAVTGKFSAGAILSGVSSVIGKLKQTGFESKNLKTEMGRMTGSMKAMAIAAGITGGALLAMLVNAVMTSPILAGSLAKLRIAFMLFGNTIAKHVKPIIEWFVKGVKWLHAKFKSLPEPIQSAIVKIIIIGGAILTLIPIILLLISILGLAKAALIAMGAPAAIAAIAGSSVALMVLAAAAGLILGILGVMLLMPVIEWFGDLGSGFRSASGSAAVLRDILMVVVGYFGAIGMAAIDIAKGDFGFSRFHAAMDVMKDVKHRLWTGEGYDEETSTSISLPAGAGGGTGNNIGTQTNIIDFGGSTFEVAGGQDGVNDFINQMNELEAQRLQIKVV